MTSTIDHSPAPIAERNLKTRASNPTAAPSTGAQRRRPTDIGAAFAILALAVSSYDHLSLLLLVIAFFDITRRALHRSRASTVTVLSALAMLYWVGMAFVIGSLRISPADLIAAAAHDGRLLVVYALLALLTMGMTKPWGRSIYETTGWSIWAHSTVLLGAWILAPSLVRSSDGLVHGFTSSHHVPGSLAAVGVLLAFDETRRSKPMRAMLVVPNLAILLLADSRAAVIGLAVALALPKLVALRGSRAWRYLGCVLIVLAAVVAMPDQVRSVGDRLGLGAAARVLTGAIDSSQRLDARTANVATRFDLFEDALHRFQRSPLVGTGPLTFDNDTQIRQVGPLVAVSEPSTQPVHTDAQAHQLVLHLLAEGGLLGAMVMLAPWTLFAKRLWKSMESQGAVGARFMVFAAAAGVATLGPLTPGIGIPALLASTRYLPEAGAKL